MAKTKGADCGNSLAPHSYNLHRDSITQFRDAMRAAGIMPPDAIEADGSLHRYRVDGDKRRSLNGWYCLSSRLRFLSRWAVADWKPVKGAEQHAIRMASEAGVYHVSGLS